ncbi:hypothetical protein BSY19_4933 (plasmid) [Bosea sp. RAC05]|nr:hypothetical protein BSY19_4933 [Bosea sp. RAC05]
MISLLIIMTLIIGLGASIGYTVYSFQRSNDLISLAQRNAAQMEGLAAAMRGALRVVEQDGPVRSPLGEPFEGQSDGRSLLPTWVAGTDRTPWGGRYGWCPYSTEKLQPSDAAGSVSSGVGKTYSVVTEIDRGRSFVVRSSAPSGQDSMQSPNIGVVGFIVSPAPFKTSISDIPDCDDVQLIDGAYLVKGRPEASSSSAEAPTAPAAMIPPRVPGSVVAVVARGSHAAGGTAVGTLVLYARPSGVNGLTPSTRGTTSPGDSADTPLSIGAALSALQKTGYKNAVLSLDAGEYTLPVAALDIPGLNLEIRATSAQASPTLIGGGVSRVSGELTIHNVRFGSDTGLWLAPGARLRMSNGALAYLRIDGGDAALSSVSIAAPSDRSHAVEVTGGRLSLAGAISLSAGSIDGYGVYASGGEIVLDNAALTHTGAAAGPWLLFNQARLSMAGTPTLNGSPILLSSTISETCEQGSASAACVATCPTLLYPASASCVADDDIPETPGTSAPAQLRSSSRVGNDAWSCAWNPGRRFQIRNNGTIIDGNSAQVEIPIGPDALVETILPLPRRRVTLQCLPTLQ